MRSLALTILLLLPAIALCCVGPQQPVDYDAEIIGKVVQITPLPDEFERAQVAKIFVIQSIKGSAVENNEYNFIIGGPTGCGKGCLKCLLEGQIAEMKFNYFSPEMSPIGKGGSIANLYFYSVKKLSSSSVEMPVNQALKAQPSAAGTPQSGAP